MRFFFTGKRIFGIRPGISLGPEDFRAHPPRRQAGTGGGPSGPNGGNFVYVVTGDHGWIKVGVTSNPNARLAQLRTGSPVPIQYAFLGVTDGDAYAIESGAHATLDRYRASGEWFSCQPQMAVAAVSAAAYSAGANIASVRLEQVPQILAATAAAIAQPEKNPSRAKWWAFGIAIWVLFFILAGQPSP